MKVILQVNIQNHKSKLVQFTQETSLIINTKDNVILRKIYINIKIIQPLLFQTSKDLLQLN